MKKYCLGIVLFLATCVCLGTASVVFSAPSSEQKKEGLELSHSIRIHGATALFALSAQLGKLFNLQDPEVRFEIEESGGLMGLKNLLNHDCEIVASSIDILQTPFALEAPKIERIPIGIDGLAIIVHPSNPIKNITLEELKKIYSGSITRWQELEGSDNEIIPISRDEDSGAEQFFINQVMKGTPLREDTLEEASSDNMVSSVASSPKAIGFVSNISVNDSVKVLTLDGVVCSRETLLKGEYPLRRTLFYCILQNAAPLIRQFIDLVQSEEGRQLIQKHGLIEITPESKNHAQK